MILAGGLGTRLLPLTRSVPKAMIPVCGRPFLEYQLACLGSCGVRDIVLCIGYRGDAIEAHFGDGSRLGLSVRYGRDGDRPLGTGGALKNVEHYLRDAFFVTYGDGYLPLDYERAMASFRQHDRAGLMVIYKNRGRYDRSNVITDGGFVVAYDKRHSLPGMDSIDFGVAILSKEALRFLPAGAPADLEELYQRLVAERQLLAYRTPHRFYEIGSPRGLAEFEARVRSGRIPTPPLPREVAVRA